MRHAPLRQWSGREWTSAVSDGRAVWTDRRPIRRALVPSDLGALTFVEDVFLPEARARGALTADQQLALLVELTAEARGALGAAPRPVAAPSMTAAPVDQQPVHPRPAYQQPAHQQPAYQQPVAASSVRPPSARPSSAFSLWFARARASAGSDLAVHGLAYLGVLLLFIGVFGLVAFAFGDVTPGLRPVAELVCAAVPFAAARMLRRFGAGVAARALEIVGGLLLPVMLVTATVDGFPVPPDLHGGALVVALTALCLATAAAFAWWARTRPDGGLRFVVAPTLWFAVAAAALGVGRTVPTGQGVAVPTGWQVTAVAAALVATLAAGRRWPRASLAAPATRACVPGTVVVAVLAALTGAAHGWPTGPVAVTGLLVLGALVLLRGQVSELVLDVAGPVWWAVVGLALLPTLALGPLAAGASVGFLLLLELAGARGRSAAAIALPGAGALACLLLVWVDPLWAAGTLAAFAAWALARRTHPYRARGAAASLDAAAAALPWAAVLALTIAEGVQAGLAGATALAVAATVPATRGVAGRGDHDPFWRNWWRGAVAAVPVLGLAAWLLADSPAQLLVASGAFLAIAAAAVVGPLGPASRPWVSVGLTTAAWVSACQAGDLPSWLRGVVVGAGALGLIVAAHRGPRRRAADQPTAAVSRGARGALGLAGHASALASLALAGPRWGLVAVVALATAGCAVTAVRADQRRSPVGAGLAAAGRPLPYLPWAGVVIGLPLLALLALDTSGVLSATDPWAAAVLAAFALGYAAATRARLSALSAPTLAWGGFTLALLAVAGAWEPWPLVVALGALAGFAWLVGPGQRAAPMRWAAWGAPAPLVGIAAHQVVAPFSALPAATQLASTLTVVGGALLIGAAAADLHGSAWLPRARPRRSALACVAVLGAVELTGALLLIVTVVPGRGAGFLAAGIAVTALGVAILARAGILAGVWGAVLWIAVLLLAGGTVGAQPVLGAAAAAAFAGAAHTLNRVTADRAWWTRWDFPVLLAAVPAALTALAAAADGDQFTRTYALVGLLAAGVAIRLRARTTLAEVLGWTGTVLVLVGAGAAGSGWLALALLGLASTHTGLAVRAQGQVRAVRQITGVVATLAAWVAALAWFAWSDQLSVNVSAAAAGAVAVVAAGAGRNRRVDPSWVAIWGGAASAVVLCAAAACLRPAGLAVAPTLVSGWVVLGAALVTVAVAGSVSPLRAPWLLDAGAAGALATVLMTFTWLDAPAPVRVTLLAAAAAALAVLTLTMTSRRGAGTPMTRVSVELGAATAAASLLVGLAELPDQMLLVPAVAAAAVQVAAAGTAWHRVGLQMLSPALACGAWLLFVSGAGRGGPQWYTIAIGLALLAVAALWRRDLQERAQPVAGVEVVAVELAGIAFLVGASFAQALTESVAHALIAALFGLAVAAWGALTQVRRRVGAGVVVVLAALVVLVAAPLVQLLPAWGGAGVWILIAVVGLLAVVATTLIERGRTFVSATRGRIGAATEGWE